MKITKTEKTISVVSDYNTVFVSNARDMGAKWNSSTRAWDFKIQQEDILKELCYDVYGYYGDEKVNGIDITVTFVEEMDAERSSLALAGIEIARAYDRDSGAKWSDRIVYKKGSCISGGSAKYWKTIVYEGTVVMIPGVPPRLLPKFKELEDQGLIKIEVHEEATQKDKLLEEKRQLEEKLAAIEEALLSL